MKIIPYGKQHIDKTDLSSVNRALKLEKITTGKIVDLFENKLSNYLKCKYSVSCNSGTSALFMSFQAINLKKNEKIIMPAINFVSSYNIVKLFGAKVFLADVDQYTGQMTPENVSDCLKKFKLKKVKAIILMYNGGYPQNAEKFLKFKNKNTNYIIEDACHAFGATYKKKDKSYMIGSCNHSDISTFSFHPLKTITTGEGGLVTTNNKNIFNKLKIIRSIGIKRSNNHWDYNVIFKSLNFRLTDFQCALGISQLNKVKKFINKRKKIFNFYNKSFSKLDFLEIPKYDNDYKSSYHLYILFIKNFTLKKKEKFIKYMKKKGIILQYHYIPINKFKIFMNEDKYISDKTHRYQNCAISLPIYYDLKKKNQNYIVNCIKKYFKR